MTEPRTIPVASPDGATSVLEEYGPLDAERTVLFLPALGVPLSYYRPFFELWGDAGEHVFALELRGQPQSSTSDVRRNDFGWNTILELDIPTALAELDHSRPVVLAGHSLGGQLSLLYAAAHPGEVDAAITIASGSSYHGALRTRRQRIMRRTGEFAIRTISTVFGYFPGHRLGFGGRQPRGMMLDWSHESRHGRYVFDRGRVDREAALADLELPVLMITLDGDKLIGPTAANHLASRVPRATIDRVRLQHSEPLDHFRWARKNPAPIVAAVRAWTDSTRGTRPE
jgi:predicted alpha/beta hydrolase